MEITEDHLEDWLALVSWLFVATLAKMKISDKELEATRSAKPWQMMVSIKRKKVMLKVN